MSDGDAIPRVMVLVPTTTYRATDYLAAARKAGVQLVIASEKLQSLESLTPGGTCVVPWDNPAEAVRTVSEFHREWPLAGIVGADDETVEAAAAVTEAFGWRGPGLPAVRLSRDKARFRESLLGGGLATPPFRVLSLTNDAVDEIEGWDHWPAVLKPRNLAASRGVMRIDRASEFAPAFSRLDALLSDRVRVPGERVIRDSVLLEGFLAGEEYSFDGLWLEGSLRTLAWFDKPHPLEGPTFAETLFVTPSEASDEKLSAMKQEVETACQTIGLTDGPLHAELRFGPNGPVLLELAPRTIGGLCARALRFTAHLSLEALILRYTAGLPLEISPTQAQAGAVHMIPVLRKCVFEEIRGVDAARKVPGICGVEITAHAGDQLEPLPEGNRYIGFVYARAGTPREAREAVAEALARLTIIVQSGDSLAEIPADTLP